MTNDRHRTVEVPRSTALLPDGSPAAVAPTLHKTTPIRARAGVLTNRHAGILSDEAGTNARIS